MIYDSTSLVKRHSSTLFLKQLIDLSNFEVFVSDSVKNSFPSNI